MALRLSGLLETIDLMELYGREDISEDLILELSGQPKCYVCQRKCAECWRKGLAEEFSPPYPLPIDEGKMPNPHTYTRWFWRHQTAIRRWIRDNFHVFDREFEWKWAIANPQILYNIINSQSIPNEVKIAYFLDRIARKDDGTFVVMGHQRAGKTTTVAWILENLHEIYQDLGKEREIYFIYPNTELQEELPDWLHVVKSIKEVPNCSDVVLDEASIRTNARKWQSQQNMVFTWLSVIAGHKDMKLFFITQHPELLDTNLRQRLSTDFILKPFMTQVSDPALKSLVDELKYYIPKDKYHTGYYDRRDGFAVMFYQPLPRDERLMNLSKLFKSYDVTTEEDVVDGGEEKKDKLRIPKYIAYCDKCGFVWEYRGKAFRRLSCNNCRSSRVFVLDTKSMKFVYKPKRVELDFELEETLKKDIISSYVQAYNL